jgi:aromatic ring-opening dioxygenase catalytic subunit (LigB family)
LNFGPLQCRYCHAAYYFFSLQVVQLSLARGLDPADHAAIGIQLRRILMRFSDCMLLCSGGLTHNLSLINVGAEESTLTNKDFVDGKARWTLAFDDWALRAAQSSHSKRIDELTHFLHAPGAVLAHPRAEHFMPFVVAAAASIGQGLRLHQRVTFGTMSLAAFGFGGIIKDVLEQLESDA